MFSLKKVIFSFVLGVSFLVGVLFVAPVSRAYAADFGFNLWNLATQPPEMIKRVLGNLSDSCRTTIVRMWGYKNTHGIDGLNNLQKVFENAPSNVKFIVALEDFPYGPAGSDPGAWFGGGYRTEYREYVRQVVTKYRGKVFMWELMNEPHCKGDASCPGKLVSWANDISTLIRSIDSSALISPGMLGDNLTDQAYQAVTALPNITANSCHFYNVDGPNTDCNVPKAIVKGLNKYFYVGEAGYSVAECTGDGLKARASFFKQKEQDFSPDAFLIWQYQMEGAGDQFSVVSTSDPICTGDTTGNISADACQGIGKSSRLQNLYGRDPYNRLLAGSPGQHRFFPWDYPYCPAISSDQYAKGYDSESFKMCTNAGSKEGVVSCPDYSPNRPYPGDTCLDFLSTHNADKTDVVKYEMADFNVGRSVDVPLCDYATRSCIKEMPVQTTSGQNAVYFKNSFVDFLGTNNEYTSVPQFVMNLKNNIKRTAMYLTDFLRGTANLPGDADRSHEIKDFIDAYLEFRKTGDAKVYQEKIAAIPNLKEILQMTGGVLGKGMTEDAKTLSNSSDYTIIERWLYGNMPHDLFPGKYDSSKDPKLMPVGDYVLAYKCNDDLNDQVFLNEENFPDSLERRDGVNPRTKVKCASGNVIPIRISDFVCSNSHPEIWNFAEEKFKNVLVDPKTGKSVSFSKNVICRGKEKPENDPLVKFNWRQEDLETIRNYFTTMTTHEDTPVRVVLNCPYDSAEKPPANEGSSRKIDGVEYTYVSQEPDEDTMRKIGDDKFLVGGQTRDLRTGWYRYSLVTRTFIYIGHLAEARELAKRTDELLFPAEVQKEEIVYDDQDSYLINKEKLSRFDTSVVKTVTADSSTKGDLISEDYLNRFAGDLWQMSPYQIAAKPNLQQGKIDKWEANPVPQVPVQTVTISGNCKVSVEIPYIKELAARTIGKTHGFYRLFFPESQQKVIDELVKAADDQGANVSAAQYVDSSGGSTDQKFFIPWVSAMKMWNGFLNYGVNPLSEQKKTDSRAIDSENPEIGRSPDTPGDSCLTQGINFRDTSYNQSQLDAMFNQMRIRYSSSALVRSDGKQLWDQAIQKAVAGGMNPYLALSYWGEETNFSSPINPNPKKGLGCGILGEKDAQGHRLSCIPNGTDYEEFLGEFGCFAGTNASCNVSSVCKNKTSTFDFIGCYQYGGSNPPGATHLKNLMYFYRLLKGEISPSCP